MNFPRELTTATRKKRVLQDIQNTRARQTDAVVPIREFYRRPDADAFTHETLGSLVMTTPGEGQLLGRLNMPAAYIHRCPDELQASNVNYWLSQRPKMEVLVRMVKSDENWRIYKLTQEYNKLHNNPDLTPEETDTLLALQLRLLEARKHRAEHPGNWVRAVLSSGYSKIDDHVLYPRVFQALQEVASGEKLEDIQLKTWESSWYFSLLRVLYHSLEVEHGERIYWGGVSISNSETGGSAIWVKPMIRAGRLDTSVAYDYLDSCPEGSTRFIHRGQVGMDRLQEAIRTAHRASQAGITRLIEVGTIRVEKPAEEAEKLIRQNDHLPIRLIEVLKSQYEKRVEATKLEIAESVLEAVKDLPAFKKQLAEEAVGRYLHLFSDIEGRIAAVVSGGAV
tara:strand:- start:51 stop:1232 length:1182 start_codon:yes stop_codon:yes gene_type:complete